MKDVIEIGSAPFEEKCAQLGTDDYSMRARAECKAFINQLRRVFGPEPEGAYLYIKSNLHDFGSYYEVACRFDTDKEESVNYAFDCENKAPARWDDQARDELTSKHYSS